VVLGSKILSAGAAAGVFGDSKPVLVVGEILENEGRGFRVAVLRVPVNS